VYVLYSASFKSASLNTDGAVNGETGLETVPCELACSTVAW
jgi:hypothetical protein